MKNIWNASHCLLNGKNGKKIVVCEKRNHKLNWNGKKVEVFRAFPVTTMLSLNVKAGQAWLNQMKLSLHICNMHDRLYMSGRNSIIIGKNENGKSSFETAPLTIKSVYILTVYCLFFNYEEIQQGIWQVNENSVEWNAICFLSLQSKTFQKQQQQKHIDDNCSCNVYL